MRPKLEYAPYLLGDGSIKKQQLKITCVGQGFNCIRLLSARPPKIQKRQRNRPNKAKLGIKALVFLGRSMQKKSSQNDKHSPRFLLHLPLECF